MRHTSLCPEDVSIIRLSEFQNRLGRLEEYICSREYWMGIMSAGQHGVYI